MVKNERIIKNIDPIKGVTPEQLHEHCSKIVKTIPSSIYLDEDELCFAVNDTVTGIYRKMESGVLDKFNYMVFRGYLFKALTNHVLQQNDYKRRKYNLPLKGTYEIYEDAAMESPYDKMDEEDAIDLLYRMIKHLSKDKQDLINYFIDGDFRYYKHAIMKYSSEGKKPNLPYIIGVLKKMGTKLK